MECWQSTKLPGSGGWMSTFPMCDGFDFVHELFQMIGHTITSSPAASRNEIPHRATWSVPPTSYHRASSSAAAHTITQTRQATSLLLHRSALGQQVAIGELRWSQRHVDRSFCPNVVFLYCLLFIHYFSWVYKSSFNFIRKSSSFLFLVAFDTGCLSIDRLRVNSRGGLLTYLSGKHEDVVSLSNSKM